MSFVKKELTKEEAKKLVNRYRITDPWPYRDDYVVNNLSWNFYNSDKDALFGLVRSSSANVINGNGMVHDPEGLDGVGVLIWQDNVIRVDYYEDLMEARREVLVVATK